MTLAFDDVSANETLLTECAEKVGMRFDGDDRVIAMRVASEAMRDQSSVVREHGSGVISSDEFEKQTCVGVA